MTYNLITVLGPTAAGKTRLASMLAREFNGEIISADSRQVYRGMDIGTGKDFDDYIIDGIRVPYHLIDISSPEEEFNLYFFNSEFYKSFSTICNRNKVPFLVGGTGLYLSSVLQNYRLIKAVLPDEERHELQNLSLDELKDILFKLKPALHNTTDLLSKDRIISAIAVAKAKGPIDQSLNPEIISLNIGIMPVRSEIKKRITQRLKFRLEHGMIEEVAALLDKGVSLQKLDFFGLEYRFVSKYLNRELNYNDMFQKLNSSIHQFAKRQSTWFRKMEREGVKIHWLNSPDYIKAKEIIDLNYFNEN